MHEGVQLKTPNLQQYTTQSIQSCFIMQLITVWTCSVMWRRGTAEGSCQHDAVAVFKTSLSFLRNAVIFYSRHAMDHINSHWQEGMDMSANH